MFSLSLIKQKVPIFVVCIICVMIIGLLGVVMQSVQQQNSQAASNTMDVVVGQVDTGLSLEVSVCVRSQGDTMTITNVSNWMQFDNSQLTPNSTIVERGNFEITDGYAPMKFEQVLPAPQNGQTTEKWSLRLDFIDGFSGRSIQTQYPELFGKVSFTKSEINASPRVSLVKTQYFFNESPNQNEPALVNLISTNFDCRDTDGDSVFDAQDTEPTNPCVPNAVGENCTTSSSQATSSDAVSSLASSTSLSEVTSSSSVVSSSEAVSSQQMSSDASQTSSAISSVIESSTSSSVSVVSSQSSQSSFLAQSSQALVSSSLSSQASSPSSQASVQLSTSSSSLSIASSQSVNSVAISSQAVESVNSSSLSSSSMQVVSSMSSVSEQSQSRSSSLSSSTVFITRDDISIDDPYECQAGGKGIITGTVSKNALSGTVTMVLINQATSQTYTFTPQINQNSGAYEIPIDHRNANAQNYIPAGQYSAEYTLVLGDQSAKGSYSFVATETCQRPIAFALPRTGSSQLLMIMVAIMAISAFIVLYTHAHTRKLL